MSEIDIDIVPRGAFIDLPYCMISRLPYHGISEGNIPRRSVVEHGHTAATLFQLQSQSGRNIMWSTTSIDLLLWLRSTRTLLLYGQIVKLHEYSTAKLFHAAPQTKSVLFQNLTSTIEQEGFHGGTARSTTDFSRDLQVKA